MIKHFIFLSIFLTVGLKSICQTNSKDSPRDFGFSTFSINGSADTINFIVSDTALKQRKPVFIFCQGSLPYSLFYKEDSTHTWQQSLPFNYKKYWKDFYFVVISKSGIPIFSNIADSDYYYIDSVTKKTPKKYLENNNLENRVKATNDVINFLIRQGWVDKSKIIIAGHSEGSKVVAKVCASNKKISHAIFLAGNPYSRFDQNIRQVQRDVLLNKKSAEEGQTEIDKLNEQIKFWYEHPNDYPGQDKEPYKNYTSFYEPILPYLLKIKIPLFVAFGTDDIISENCNLLPFEFARLGKTNLTLKSYLDCDHGFKKSVYNKDKQLVSKEEMFDKVAADFFEWIKTTK
ncbi:MAG: alpha/beta hydrolase family protein [Chitinophagaceae bacterium]